MFWRYNNFTSHIETLLDKDNVTIHELMDEDDVIQECKGQNPKLLDFLVRPEVMDTLISLITEEPGDEVDEKTKYKYPNIACELITSDISRITDTLTEKNILLDKIYRFLSAQRDLNPLLSSFFTKVMMLLLNRKTDYLFEYLKSKDGDDKFINLLLPHLGTCAIMDLLTRMVQYDPMYEIKPQIVSWLDEESLVERLVDRIHPDFDEETHTNSSLTLCEIIRFHREQLGSEIPQPDPLMDKLESEVVLNRLLSNMLDNPAQRDSVMTNGLSVLQTLFEYRRCVETLEEWRPMSDGEPSALPALPEHEQERLDRAVAIVIKCVTPRVKQLADFLTKPLTSRDMTTTVGTLVPLGFTRLYIVKLLSSFYKMSTVCSAIHPTLIENNVLNVLLDLFFEYQWSNFLHSQVAESIENLLCSNSSNSSESGSQKDEGITPDEAEPDKNEDLKRTDLLLKHLYVDCHIVERMLQSWNKNDEVIKSGGRRAGYMGHVTKICNDLVQAAKGNSDPSQSSQIISCIEGLGADVQTSWTDLVIGPLSEANRRNTSDLVGGHPLVSSSGSDDDSDFRDINFTQDDRMQQAFSDYQVQQLTSTFIEQFGMAEQEFGDPNSRTDAPYNKNIANWSSNTEMTSQREFEEVCNSKVSDLADEGEDDEDVWQDREIINPGLNGTNASFTVLSKKSASSRNSDSDNSSSSDEELGSPAVIRSQPMETDDEPAPIAMDTASPWEIDTTPRVEDSDDWTAFGVVSAEKKDDDTSDEGWADFSSLNSEPSGPRASSPEPLTDRPNEVKVNVTIEDGDKEDSLNDSLEQVPIDVDVGSPGSDVIVIVDASDLVVSPPADTTPADATPADTMPTNTTPASATPATGSDCMDVDEEAPPTLAADSASKYVVEVLPDLTPEPTNQIGELPAETSDNDSPAAAGEMPPKSHLDSLAEVDNKEQNGPIVTVETVPNCNGPTGGGT